jgi:gamma-glutamylcyclotransferase (GGCT)/AIG2-like uncharacterized protein YtfP
MIAERNHTVFVYGSLMSGLQNHAILERGRATFISRATCADMRMLSLGAFPACVFEPGGGVAKGELYECGDDCMEALDRLEGHPRFYARQLALIESAGGQRLAWVYVLSRRSASSIESEVPARHAQLPCGDWRAHAGDGWRHEPCAECQRRSVG